MSVNPFSCLVKNVEASKSSLCQIHVHWRPSKMTVFAYLFFPEKRERGGRGTEQSWENRDFGRQVILLNSLWMLCLLGGKGSFNLPSLLTPTLSSNRTWAHVGRQWFVSPSSTQIQIGDFDFSSSLTNLNFGFEEKKKKKAYWFISSLEGISCWILSNWSALLFCVQLSP